MGTPKQVLQEGLAALGLTVAAEAQARLLAYLDLLLRWNRVYKLTAITEPARMVSHHLLDSLAAVPIVDGLAPARVLDVGSGGGQPGIPWAIVRPEWRITLLDSNSKKTSFLRQAAIDLALPGVEVVCGRVETHAAPAAYEVITSRAFADLAQFVGLTRHLLAPQGHWVAFKGHTPAGELPGLPPDVQLQALQPLSVPGLAAERCLALLGPTPVRLAGVVEVSP